MKPHETNAEKYKRVSLELPKEEEVVVIRREEKDYDINALLKKVKEEKVAAKKRGRPRKNG